MLRLAKAFLDIAFWRKSPAQLPASVLLLCLVAGAAALLEVIGALLARGAERARFSLRIVLTVLLPLAFAWVVLAIARQRQRFLQTGTALLGVAVLAEFVLYPLGSLMNIVGSRPGRRLPLGVLCWSGSSGICSPAPTSGAPRSMRGSGSAPRSAWAICCCRWRWSSSCCRSLDACTCTSWALRAPSWAASRRSPRPRDFASPARI